MSNIFYTDILPGTISGIAQVMAGHPFDTVKVNLQTQVKNSQYTGMMDCFKKIVTHNGVR